MSNLSKKDVQVAYANAIEILFGGVIKAEPSQVTEQVIKDVDTMIYEIANCSKNIVQIGIDIIYKVTVERGIGAVKGLFIDNLLLDILFDKATQNQQDYIKELFDEWMHKLIGNRRFRACIYQARRNWRSKVEMELMGI